MTRHPFAVLVVALALSPLSCGGDDKPAGDGQLADEAQDQGGDEASPDGETTPAPPAFTYVLSRINLPEDGAEAQALGLDIDGEPGDGIDNQLGTVLGSLSTLAPEVDLQDTVDRGVSDGTMLLLAVIGASNLVDEADASYLQQRGASASPTPCSDAEDTVCRRHLAGDGVFTVDGSAAAATFAGSISGGTLSASGRAVTLELPVDDATTLVLDLQQARVELGALGEDGWEGRLGGAIAMSDVEADLVPAFAAIIRASVSSDCASAPTPPDCGCAADSRGARLIEVFDTSPNDCDVSDGEVGTRLIAFLTADIDLDGDGTHDAVSLGVGITAVKGTFDAP